MFHLKSKLVLGVILAGIAVLELPGSASAQPGSPPSWMKGYGLMQWQKEHGQWSSPSPPKSSHAYSPPRLFAAPRSYGYVTPFSTVTDWGPPAVPSVPTVVAPAVITRCR